MKEEHIWTKQQRVGGNEWCDAEPRKRVKQEQGEQVGHEYNFEAHGSDHEATEEMNHDIQTHSRTVSEEPSLDDEDANTLITMSKLKSLWTHGCPYCMSFEYILEVYDTVSDPSIIPNFVANAKFDREDIRQNTSCMKCQWLTVLLDLVSPALSRDKVPYHVRLRPGRYSDSGSGRYPVTYNLEMDERSLNLVRAYTRADSKDVMHQRLKFWDPDRVDTELIKDWLQFCKRNHGGSCDLLNSCRDCLHNKNDLPVLERIPLYFIDVESSCLVNLAGQALGNIGYLALSYVWEKEPSPLTASTTNITKLMQRMALDPGNPSIHIPNTIRDAMRLTAALGYKYLWVDRLCIVQDDLSTAKCIIKAMDSIYANATLTVVAAGGEDAKYGLRGLGGNSKPRNARIGHYGSRGPVIGPFRRDGETIYKMHVSEDIIQFGEATLVRISTDDQDVPGLEHESAWATRGWTYQEHLLSNRLLIFGENGRFEWRCKCAEWQEEYLWDKDGVDCGHPMRSTSLRSELFCELSHPDLDVWSSMVQEYNQRNLTFHTDAYDAFSGVLNIFETSFPGGFFYGLPELFFHHAILWQPLGTMERRGPESRRFDLNGLPSWSWLHWKGKLNRDSLSAASYILEKPSKLGGTELLMASSQILPTVEFFKKNVETDTFEKIDAITSLSWGASPPDRNLPNGWTRHAYTPDLDYITEKNKQGLVRHQLEETIPSQFTFFGNEARENWPRRHTRRFLHDNEYFTHESCKDIKFRFPIPLGRTETKDNSLWHPFIFFHSQKATLRLGGFVQATLNEISARYILDDTGNVTGSLLPNLNEGLDQLPAGFSCDVVQVSEGAALDFGTERLWRMDNWGLPEGLEGLDAVQTHIDSTKVYRYANVLWMEWNEGKAYRRGVGRIEISAWLRSNLQSVTVALG